MIDWQKVVLNIRRHYKSLHRVAREIQSNERHLNRIARGEVNEPRFNTGLRLLDLHHKVCPQEHSLERIKL
jgi:hypothetical protein